MPNIPKHEMLDCPGWLEFLAAAAEPQIQEMPQPARAEHLSFFGWPTPKTEIHSRTSTFFFFVLLVGLRLLGGRGRAGDRLDRFQDTRNRPPGVWNRSCVPGMGPSKSGGPPMWDLLSPHLVFLALPLGAHPNRGQTNLNFSRGARTDGVGAKRRVLPDHCPQTFGIGDDM